MSSLPQPPTSNSNSNSSTYHHTYWCSECDMSIPLSQPNSITPPPTRCPHCQNCFLEHMDSFPPFGIHHPTTNPSITPTRHYLQRLMHQLANTASPGSPRAAIQSLKTIAIRGDLFDNCPICKDQFAAGTVANELPCGHLFHNGCIVPWLQINNTCPLCRFRLVSEEDDLETREDAGFIGAMTLDELFDDDDDISYENEFERGVREGGRMVFSPTPVIEEGTRGSVLQRANSWPVWHTEGETEVATSDVNNVVRA